MATASTVRIRPALPYDRSEIRDVNRQVWQSDYTHIFSDDEIHGLFDFRLKQHGSWIYRRDRRLPMYVAIHEGRIIGFIGSATLINHQVGEITSLYVLSEYQGEGIGTRLWHTALEGLRDHDCHGVWVWVLEKANARAFYEKRGCVERERGIYKVGQHGEVAVGYYYPLKNQGDHTGNAAR